MFDLQFKNELRLHIVKLERDDLNSEIVQEREVVLKARQHAEEQKKRLEMWVFSTEFEGSERYCSLDPKRRQILVKPI